MTTSLEENGLKSDTRRVDLSSNESARLKGTKNWKRSELMAAQFFLVCARQMASSHTGVSLQVPNPARCGLAH